MMRSTTGEINPGDILLIRFPYASDVLNESKRRPVLVVGVTPPEDKLPFALVLMVTGSQSRLTNPEKSDLLIDDWSECGLVKPSLVRTGRVWGAEIQHFDIKLGSVGKAFLAKARKHFTQSYGLGN